MFLTREKKILKLLFAKKDVMTTSEMATKLDVSTRTVKTDIKRINGDEAFLLNGCQIMTKAGVGFWLSFEEEGERFLRSLLYDEESVAAFLQPENRKYFAALKLFQSTGFISMENISKDMYISKSTICNTVNELELFLEKYDLRLKKKAKFGIMVEGKESDIRKANVAALEKIVGKPGRDIVEKSKPFFKDLDLNLFHPILRDMETKRHVMFADISYYEILLLMSVSIDRAMKGFICKATDANKDIFVVGHEFEMVPKLRSDIEEAFGITLGEYDLAYILFHISSAKNQITDNREILSLKQLYEKKPELYDFSVKVLEEIQLIYNIDFFEDDEFLSTIILHFISMVKRAQQKMYLDNPFLETVKSNMVYEYEIALSITDQYNTAYGIKIDENEIGFVALYVGAVFERMITTRIRRKKPVILVCVTGTGTAQFLRAKLTRLFPDIEIEKVIPLNKVNMLKGTEGKLIISTVPVEIANADVICVSPILDESDTKLIMSYLDKHNDLVISNKKEYPLLGKLIDKKITILQCDCRSKDEVIKLMGTRLANEGYVDEGYIDSVFERENLSDTSIGNLFAIPHAFGNHVLKNGIGLITLKKQVLWGKEKAQIIFMLSIDSNTRENLHETFSEVIDLMSNPGSVDTLIKAEKFSDLETVIGNRRLQ